MDPFASARVLARRFLTSGLTIKEILHRDRRLKKFTALGAPFLFFPRRVAGIEASTEMARILHESKESRFEGIAIGESWFQYSYPSSKIVARSPTDVIPRMQQAIGTKKTMITILFTGCKRIVLDILLKGSAFNQPYFANSILPDLKRENVNFHRRILQTTFWVHIDSSMHHIVSKVASKLEKHHVSRLPHPPDSADISPWEFWLFGLLKVVLKDREFDSSDESEEAIRRSGMISLSMKCRTSSTTG
jgi:hypothetical protein